MKAVPCFPSLVAVMLTGPPALTPLTRPLASTVAIEGLADAQVTTRSVSRLLFASRTLAVSRSVSPTRIVSAAGAIVTEATGTRSTVISAHPLLFSLVAVILTGPPSLTPVTRPVVSTAATEGFADAQVMTRSGSRLLFASRTVAVSRSVSPTRIVSAAGATVTDSTGGRGSGSVLDPPSSQLDNAASTV